MSSSALFRAAALSGAGAVLLGAFGAHGLQKSISDLKLLKNWETASSYLLAHSIAAALGAAVGNEKAAWLFLGGNLIFSGSLYVLVLSGKKWLGAITPIGGLALVGGWLALALGSNTMISGSKKD
jgi:uncharacterized membrane protein YgdD (TMEM256/DUF423 family)